MIFVALDWQTLNFWTVQVVFHPMPHPSLQTGIYIETICNLSFLMYQGGV